MKITLTSQFIRYIYQNYMKISWNTIDQVYSKRKKKNKKKKTLVSTTAFKCLSKGLNLG